MLKKKKLWFTVSVVVQILMLVYAYVYDRIYGALVVRRPDAYQEKILALRVVGILGALCLALYLAYRLFYLYRDTEARGKWTAVNLALVGVIALMLFDRAYPLLSVLLLVHLFLPYALVILTGVCILRDYHLISQEE